MTDLEMCDCPACKEPVNYKTGKPFQTIQPNVPKVMENVYTSIDTLLKVFSQEAVRYQAEIDRLKEVVSVMQKERAHMITKLLKYKAY
ncbi:hypothetical protein QT971_06350 [Microcoleus sp. herbarium19]|uniref:hypothetical protein n=1 Tax=Microcoleus sp. herbarium19 TaxID=3055440 RepID=UPI002FD6C618